MRSLLLAAAALGLVFAAAAPAQAVTDETVIARISHDDLNLNNEAGATALLGRIDEASTKVCADMGARKSEMQTCINKTSERAVNALNHPMVTAMFYLDHTMLLASAD